MAHQFIAQLDEGIKNSVFGNVGSMVSFRVGAEDATILAQEYSPIFKERDIINLGVREFYTKMSVNGQLREAFSGMTLDAPVPTEDHTDDIIAWSRSQYCITREEVEDMLKRWDEAAAAPPSKEEIDVGEVFEEPLL